MQKLMSGRWGAVILLFTAICGSSLAQQAPPPGQQQQQSKPAVNEPEAAAVPGLTGAAAPVDPKTYLIGPNDVLMIRVWREAELSGPVIVRPDGVVTLPLVGEVKAGGVTPEQLRVSLVDALNKYITKPEVMVSVQSVQSKKYYITGEVNRTGPFPLVVPTTVMEALSEAGGFREFANKKKIVIIRGKDRIKFNYNDVIKGKNLDLNIYLQDGDHIYVPD